MEAASLGEQGVDGGSSCLGAQDSGSWSSNLILPYIDLSLPICEMGWNRTVEGDW